MNAQAQEVAPVEGVIEESPTTRESRAIITNPTQMLALAVERGAGLETLEKFMALQERWEANEARKAYVAAMAAFKAEPMEILKRKLVEFQTRDGDTTSYHHAELSDVTDVVVPAMGKHGLSHRWDMSQKGNEITVTCTITHKLGHMESVSMTAMPDASGKKNAIQQVASTVTYLQRYTLLALTGMATKGMDDDGRTSEEILPEDQPEPLTKEQEEAARDERKRGYFIEAYSRREDVMLQVKERLAFGDLKGAATAWYDLPENDQMALYIAPTKAGEHKSKAFTTAQREMIKNDLPKYHPQRLANDTSPEQ